MENLIACLVFDYSKRANKAGDRVILKDDLAKLCQAVSKLLEVQHSKGVTK